MQETKGASSREQVVLMVFKEDLMGWDFDELGRAFLNGLTDL
ncbi:hypothetical protein ACFLVG_04845 [Chloroflexota bacterium]